MQQAPWWVLAYGPSLAAAIGALIALGGQYIAGRRERGREKERSAREDKYRNHADRRVAYEKLMIVLVNWQIAVQEITVAGRREWDTKRSQLDERLVEFMQLREAMRLLAPLEVRQSWDIAGIKIQKITTELEEGSVIDAKSVGEIIANPLKSMRADLGIADAASPEIQ
ncbi:hypothetical protein [Paractinoplanes lichenicola]|uniref:Uncharacterized protein n=1 Tax=Paractinoplanes lichenicola TaxID=2802976 RepID=A0ABS1W3M2_9ACTN|nr:hypothetical protein [Actinoplanes lichenicola]MBL7261331.1 hypothetical protein [Actinoplanes lichenicola]